MGCGILSTTSFGAAAELQCFVVSVRGVRLFFFFFPFFPFRFPLLTCLSIYIDMAAW